MKLFSKKRNMEGAVLNDSICRKPFRMEYIALPLAVCLVMFVASSFCGKWLTSYNSYRSYSLQACAWLEGRLDLGKDYKWLELAVYNGKYYVSFPPFPSFVLLPFAAIWGEHTPDHFVSLFFTLLGVIYALKLYYHLRKEHEGAWLYVLFLFLGNGYLFIAMQGWVWYLAQCMCFALSLMALYYAAVGKGGWSLAFWGCAVGCRPMVILYLPLLVYLIYCHHKQRDDQLRFFGLVRKKWYWAVPVCLIAGVYMWLNFVRFGNPLEFGHNYLPEFVKAEKGQFSLSYIPANLSQLLSLPRTGGSNGALFYEVFGCNNLWLIAPILFSFGIACTYAIVYHGRRMLFPLIALPLMLLMHLLVVCSHRTLGGFQFGNRYIVDMLPFVFYGLLLFKPRSDNFNLMNAVLFMFGFAINLVGTVAVYADWI